MEVRSTIREVQPFMRLLLELEAMADAAYDLQYYHKAQGFIYNIMRETAYSDLHGRQGPKFFCFSNIFPIGDMKAGDVRKWIISSPDPVFIGILAERIRLLDAISIGEMRFGLVEAKPLKMRLADGARLASATPIVLRIPQEKYAAYSIESGRPGEFWRPEYPFECFIKQLEENLFKKYNAFHGAKIGEFPLFGKFRFVKTVSNHVVIDNAERTTVGSMWEFFMDGLSADRRRAEFLEFASDCGFGERNSYGFGFVNVVR